MIKNFTTAQVRELGAIFFKEWNDNKNDVKLNGKSLYYLISLKKILEQKLTVIEETISTLASQCGAIPQEDGNLFIPEDRREEAGKLLADLGNETLEIEYSEIILDETSYLPLGIYDILFDFIKFED